MTNNKNNDLSPKKIASEEGVSRREIAADIAEQLHDKEPSSREAQDLTKKIATEEGLSRMEIKRDMAEQMPGQKVVNSTGMSTGTMAWFLVAAAAVIGIVIWVIYH